MKTDPKPPPHAAKTRLGRAAALLLGVVLASFSAFGIFLIWHLARRARLIREGLGPPRRISLPDPKDLQREDRATFS